MATMQDVVRRIQIQASAQGVDQVSASLLKLASAQGEVAVATAATDKATLSITSKLNALQRSIDPVYRGEQQLASAERLLAAARAQGAISIERQNELLTLASGKYLKAGESAIAMGEGLRVAEDAAKGVLATLGPIAGIAALAELPSKIMDAVHDAAGLTDVAETIGITTDKLQELDYAGAQFHISADAMDSALERFSKNLGEAATGSGDLAKELKVNRLAITGDLVTDFMNYANLLKNTKNEQDRNLLSMAAFGRGAAEMGTMASAGAAGVREQMQAAIGLGDVLSGSQLSDAKELDAEFVKMQAQIGATFSDFAITVAPAVELALVQITDYVKDLKTAIDGLQTGKLQDVVNLAVDIYKLTPGVSQLIQAGQLGMAYLHNQSAGTSQIVVHGGSSDNDQIERSDHASTIKGVLQSGFYQGPTKIYHAPDADAVAQQKAIDSVTKSLALQTAALTESDKQAFIDQQLSQAKVTISTNEGQSIERMAAAYYDEKKAVEAANQASQFLATTLSDAFIGVVDGSTSVVSAVENITKALADAVLQSALLGSGPLSGIFGTQSPTTGGVGGLFGSLLSDILVPSISGGASIPSGGFIPGLTGPRLATGGTVSGPGTATSDSVPAMLSAGEYVVNAKAASAHRGMLDAINFGSIRKMAAGGAMALSPMGEHGPECIIPLKRSA